MLKITIPLTNEGWDEERCEFVEPIVKTLELEHSLISLSKWESKWCKPFLTDKAKTDEETIDYIKCMTLTKNVDDSVYLKLTKDNVIKINEYISAPMTATTFSGKETGKKSREMVTSELIYYWMISLGIPKDCEKWHINRLLTLIRIFNAKNTPAKKRSQRDIINDYAAINAANKKLLNTKG